MTRHAFVMTGLFLAAVAAAAEKPDFQALADKQQWEWADDRAGLIHSLLTYQGFHEIQAARVGLSGLSLRVKPHNWVNFAFDVHAATAFVGAGDMVYWADYHPGKPGCTLRAYDLRQARYVWQTPLKSTGLDRRSWGRNRIRMELFEDVVMVWGEETCDESGGRYVEIVDRQDGKTVGHKRFAKDAAAVAVGTSPRPQMLRDVIYGPVNRHGKWSYQVVVEMASTRSRRSRGVVQYDGKAIMARRGQRLWTPWGEMGWDLGPYSRGWLPVRIRPAPKGKEIDSPDPPTSRRVKDRWQSISKALDTLVVTVAFDAAITSSRPAPRFPSVLLHVPAGAGGGEAARTFRQSAPASSHWLAGRIDARAASGLLGVLAQQGFLARASADGAPLRPARLRGRYLVRLQWNDGRTAQRLTEDIGWDLPVYERLCLLRACLNDEQAPPLEAVLARCRSQLDAWRTDRLNAAAKR